MIDYVEGLIAARKLIAEIDSACLNHNYTEAAQICDVLLVEVRMLRNQILIQGGSNALDQS